MTAWLPTGCEGRFSKVFALIVTRRRGGSVLKVVHSGFPRQEKWADLYDVAERGWTYYSMNMKSVLETGKDPRAGPED
jgi:hypothetical protein